MRPRRDVADPCKRGDGRGRELLIVEGSASVFTDVAHAHFDRVELGEAGAEDRFGVLSHGAADGAL